MCGIAGKLYFQQKNIVTKEEIVVMTDAIQHRGPDDAGIFVDKNLGFGHCRLSIIDLSSAGHQPMSSNDEKTWITFNGEIYNFLDLRKELEADGIKFHSNTDTEIIIYLYKKYGPECLKKLRGMFALAIWDKDTRELFVARDRVGKKPLKYYFDKNVFIFASELKAILKNKEVKKEIDYLAIDEYLTFGYVPSPKTGYKNIYKLEPASYMLIKESGEVTKKQYWNIDFSQKLNLNENEWEDKILNKLQESIKIRLMADVPLGAHLSGGIDSSLIVALMSKQMTQRVKTFSVGFEEKSYDETKYARLVAQKYNTDHTEIFIKPDAAAIIPELARQYEEPFADNSALPTWYLCQATKEKLTVALNGDGGDENFAGYKRYEMMKLYNVLKYLPAKGAASKISELIYQTTGINNFLHLKQLLANLNLDPLNFYINNIAHFSDKDKIDLYSNDFKKNINQPEAAYKELFDQTAQLDWLDKFLYLGIKSHLPDGLTPKVDIASMAFGLEIRSPLLDHELMELAAKIPSSLKIKGGNKKYLLKKIAYKYLPKECIDRPKQGFDAPLKFWFKNDLKKFLLESDITKELVEIGINKKYLDEIVNENSSRQFNYSKKIWNLIMLANWLKI